MSVYYLLTGYSTMAMTAEVVDFAGSLPLPDSAELKDVVTHSDPAGLDDRDLFNSLLTSLGEGDLLVVVHANIYASFIPDEWVNEYRVPAYRKQDLYNRGGILSSFEEFSQAQTEPWYWLINADTGPDGSPVLSA